MTQYKLCRRCREWLPLSVFTKGHGKCNDCRAFLNQAAIECKRNKPISKALAFPRVVV